MPCSRCYAAVTERINTVPMARHRLPFSTGADQGDGKVSLISCTEGPRLPGGGGPRLRGAGPEVPRRPLDEEDITALSRIWEYLRAAGG